MSRPSFSTQLFALWILVAVLFGLLTSAVVYAFSSALGERVGVKRQQALAAARRLHRAMTCR